MNCDGVLLVPALPTPQSKPKLKTTPPASRALVLLVLLVVLGGIRVPGESLLVERDDHLRTLDVGLFGWHEVGLVRIFPAQKY